MPSPSLHRLRIEVEETGVGIVRLLHDPVFITAIELVELILGVVGVRVQRLEPVKLTDLPLDQPIRLALGNTNRDRRPCHFSMRSAMLNRRSYWSSFQ